MMLYEFMIHLAKNIGLRSFLHPNQLEILLKLSLSFIIAIIIRIHNQSDNFPICPNHMEIWNSGRMEE
jgi:hypothetical protein